eukprot:COSAG01_NODE_1885_length_8988_cov_2.861514_1_plen_28_part_10
MRAVSRVGMVHGPVLLCVRACPPPAFVC